jgi:hypothetical protein
MEQTDELFYITGPHGSGCVGNSVLWWATNRCGYTTDLNLAGQYPRAEAESICSDRRGDKMFPVADVDKMVQRHVDIQILRHYEEAADERRSKAKV